MTYIPQILMAVLLAGVGVIAILRHGSQSPKSVFSCWPVLGGLLLEIGLLTAGRFWS
jgi:hypothetical protein